MKYMQILKELLQDRNVLYLTLFAALSNLFIYMVMREYQAIIFFVITGLLASYFSKNMIIIMLTSILATGIVVSLKIIGKVREGMESQMKQEESEEKAEEEGKDVSEASRADKAVAKEQREGKPIIERITPVGAEASVFNKDKPKINYADTLEAAYSQLDKLLDSSSIEQMSSQTERLAENQKKLMKTMEKMEPMLNKAGELMQGLDVNNIANKITQWQSLIKDLPAKEQKV